MKLLTHNMLMAPGTKNGFPLAIEVEKMETVESEFRSEFTARMVQKVEYGALLQTLAGLGMDGTLPPAVPDSYESNEEFLRALHHVLMEVEVIDGTLVCPETGKRFPIKDGIPSML